MNRAKRMPYSGLSVSSSAVMQARTAAHAVLRPCPPGDLLAGRLRSPHIWLTHFTSDLPWESRPRYWLKPLSIATALSASSFGVGWRLSSRAQCAKQLARRHQAAPARSLASFLRRTLTREIRIASHLHFPNILPVLDGELDGLPFYVTPYIPGESLSQRLKRESQLSIPDTIDIACQVADTLETAHAQRFMHRDIKPSNILLAGDLAILADFGLARALDVVTAERLTESGIALGTPSLPPCR